AFRSPGLLLVVGIAGPASTWVFYTAAVRNYVAFGELVSSAIDLFRFDLLDRMQLARPGGLRDERELWEGLQRLNAYGQEGIDVGYLRPAEKKA
ncbi:MAG: hypothetical protein ABWZ85_03970, partial [Luteibacter sp.]